MHLRQHLGRVAVVEERVAGALEPDQLLVRRPDAIVKDQRKPSLRAREAEEIGGM